MRKPMDTLLICQMHLLQNLGVFGLCSETDALYQEYWTVTG
jgi:hypothetical protein